MFTESELNLVEFLARLLASPAPPRSDFVYCYSETSDHEDALLESGASMMRLGLTFNLAIAAQEAATGNPGSDTWVKKLNALGVQRHNLMLIPQLPRPDSLNTLTETESFVQFAKVRGLRSVIIIAPAFHLPRAFITAVSVAHRTYPALRVYPVLAIPQPWDEVATHSQGVVRAKRTELLRGEFERIQRYFEKGDLLSLRVALEYLRTP